MLKKILSTLLVLVILAGLGYGGYRLISQQTKKKLAELVKQTQTTEEKKTTSVSSEPAIAPNQPKTEKNSAFSLKTETGTTVKLGETFNLQVVVTANDDKVDGAEFLLTYDPKLVEVDEPVLGTFFALYPQKTVDNTLGQVRVIALQEFGKSLALNEEIVVNLPVKALAVGKAVFNFDQSKTHIAGYGGQELLKEASPLTINIE